MVKFIRPKDWTIGAASIASAEFCPRRSDPAGVVFEEAERRLQAVLHGNILTVVRYAPLAYNRVNHPGPGENPGGSSGRRSARQRISIKP